MSSDAVPGVSSPFDNTSPPSAPPSSKEPSQPQSSPKKKQHHDLINRGSKRSNPLATTLFVGLRALDPFWQYAILSSTSVVPRLLSTLQLTPTPLGTPLSALTNYHAASYPSSITTLGLSPTRTLILTLSIGSALKQIFWILVTSEDEFPTSAAVVVSLFNTVNNSLNTLLYCTALTSSAFYPTEWTYGYNVPQILGATLFASGILIEAASEVQRQVFKAKAENKGKLCTTGFWGVARHVNYGGYMVWRSGYAMVCSGFVWGGVVAGFFGWNFANEAIEVLDEYCGKKYGEGWEDYKRDVPWKLVPGVY